MNGQCGCNCITDDFSSNMSSNCNSNCSSGNNCSIWLILIVVVFLIFFCN